jgi:hypothetical protein
MVHMPLTVASIEIIMVSPASRFQRERRQPYWPLVVTIAKGYDLGYIWKSHGVKPAQCPRLLRP